MSTPHNDNARKGADLLESISTSDAVATPGRFGWLFHRQVNGHVYGRVYMATFSGKVCVHGLRLDLSGPHMKRPSHAQS